MAKLDEKALNELIKEVLEEKELLDERKTKINIDGISVKDLYTQVYNQMPFHQENPSQTH